MKDFDDMSDLGAVPLDDMSDLGAVPIDNIQGSTEGFTVPETGLISDARDLGLGLAQGLTFSGADELTGAIKAAYAKLNPSTTEEEAATFADLYRKKQQESQKSFEEASERSPWLYGAGQIAGGVTSGAATGGLLGLGSASVGAARAAVPALTSSQRLLALGGRGLSTYKTALPVILGEAALSSKEGGITSVEEAKQLGKDVLGGAAFALPATIGLQGVAEGARLGANKLTGGLRNYIEESPQLRQMERAFKEYGKKVGVNPSSETAIDKGVMSYKPYGQELMVDIPYEGGTKFSLLNTKRAEGIANKIIDVDEKLGKAVGDSLDTFTNKIDASDIELATRKTIDKLKTEIPSIDNDMNFKAMTDRILSRNYKNASARDIKNTIDDATSIIEKVSGWTTPTPEQEEIVPLMRNLRKQLNDRLKNEVPEYRDAAERFKQFRAAYIEQPIKGGGSLTSEDVIFGKMKRGEDKLIKAYEDMIENASGASKAVKSTEARFAKFGDAGKQFETSETDRLSQGKIQESIIEPIEDTLTQIKNWSDDAAVRSNVRKTNEAQGGIIHTIKDIMLLGNTGRGAALQASYMAGKASRIGQSGQNNPISKVVSSIYRAPQETTLALSQKLKSVPGLEKYGKSLEDALNSPDANRRNQVLFTIMQNPQARLFVNEETNDSGEEQP